MSQQYQELFGILDRIISRYESKRKNWMNWIKTDGPGLENIDLILVGESPPWNFDNYFYNVDDEKKLPKGGFFERIMETTIDKRKSKERNLKNFFKKGMWLTDFFQYPLKGKSNLEGDLVNWHRTRFVEELGEFPNLDYAILAGPSSRIEYLKKLILDLIQHDEIDLELLGTEDYEDRYASPWKKKNKPLFKDWAKSYLKKANKD